MFSFLFYFFNKNHNGVVFFSICNSITSNEEQRRKKNYKKMRKNKLSSHLHLTGYDLGIVCECCCAWRANEWTQIICCFYILWHSRFTFLWIGSSALMLQSNGYMKISSIMIFYFFLFASLFCITIVLLSISLKLPQNT